MNNAFIDLLRRLISVLPPLSEANHAGSMTWDGKAYVPATQQKFDPSAAKRWATLTAIAEMLEKQGTALSPEQRACLDRLLFGGMGSLNDFQIDERQVGEEARLAN